MIASRRPASRARLPVALAVFLVAAAAWAEAPPASLDKQTVPASGRGEAILRVERFGRYAVAAGSEQGVSVQILDRMAGPGEVSGEPGGRDGRVDLFLDRGEVKVVTRGHEKAAGEAALSVRPFRELQDPAPRLVELKPVSASLGDLEQRSFWLDLPAERWVLLEAAGRNLSDLRLWKDGTWLVDASAGAELLEPAPGKPLRCLRIAAKLEPGLYLLTAYGGPDEPWAEDPSLKTKNAFERSRGA